MRSIQRLPESVHNSMRSGVVICDFTTIVEELILNSLEAGATKISVAVGVRSCYVKVVDNGHGITRDGLLLLGEQHATSKVNQVTLMDTGIESIGFHGEALCSISNVSLLEIVTKARGKPNGYKKMMKNSECLFLGINDDKQDAGTTVVVRDMFYNQPVRRKHMESSPNKVLDSIKTTVLRIALVHVNVCFKVVDADSVDELLHYGPSSSPLSLLSSNFGIGDSISFNKVDLSDGELKLSGFISDPCEKFYPKAIQNVYINSRFICKGLIHKLVNQLAAKFDFSQSWLPATSYQDEKQNKYDICPTFILNLCCPRSYYDMITSEQSRRMVEFKDWGPILTLVENGILHLWAQNISYSPQAYPRRAHPLETDMPGTLQRKKRSIKQKCEISLDLSSPQPKKLRTYDNIPTVEEYVSSIFKPSRRVPELKKHHTVPGFQSETGYQSPPFERSLADYKITMKSDILSHASPGSVFFQENMPCTYDTKVDCLSSSSLGNSSLEVDGIDYISTSSGVSTDHVKFSDKVYGGKDNRKSLLWSCSFQGISSFDRPAARDEQFEFENENEDDARFWKRWVGCDDGILDNANQSHGRDLHYDGSSPADPSSLAHFDVYETSKFPDSLKRVGKGSSSLPSSKSGWSPMPMKQVMGITFRDDDAAIYKRSVEDYSNFGSGSLLKNSAWMEEDNLKYSNCDGLPQKKCSAMCFSHDNEREITEFHWGDSLKSLKRSCKTDWSPLPSYIEGSRNCSLQLSHEMLPSKNISGRANIRHRKAIINRKEISVRSHSAPPYYKGKKRYLDLTDSSAIFSAKCHLQNRPSKSFSNEPNNSNHANTRMICSQKSFGTCLPSPVKGSFTDCSFNKRELTPETVVNQKTQKRNQFMKLETVECPDMKVNEDSLDSGSKWRNCCPSTAGGIVPEYKNQDNILDISSGILDHPNDSLIPKSIGRMTLEDAKVLNQVDKKFIPVVAGKNLAIIDQHAADERIRLEELRHKVLTGEMRTITYLDSGQELVLPEIGYQLLHNYAEQIQTWGWICNIHSQDTSSFAKHLDSLHRQPTVIKLLAVPCILGVKLTDIDLLEFLQQLADTDGSSTIPPSVNRVLNNKACRGAIMFGDALLLSECSLIVEELKRTSLCFQCAHGRPTTVPLVNLDILHQKIAKHDSHKASWHGLQHHKLSLERSTRRINSSRH